MCVFFTFIIEKFAQGVEYSKRIVLLVLVAIVVILSSTKYFQLLCAAYLALG